MSILKAHKFRVTDEKWKSFSSLCNAEGKTCSEKIRELIDNTINQNDFQNNTNQNVIDFCDDLFQRTGRVVIECIESRFTPVLQEEAKRYCQQKKYPLVRQSFLELRPYSGEFNDW